MHKQFHANSEVIGDEHIWNLEQYEAYMKENAAFKKQLQDTAATRRALLILRIVTWFCIAMAIASTVIAHDLTNSILNLSFATVGIFTIKDLKRSLRWKQ